MIPMRRVFVVDSPELKFPEGVACAEVLRVGETTKEGEEEASSGTRLVFTGLGVGALLKICISYLGLFKQSVEWAMAYASRVFYIGTDISPALVAVGVVVGLPIAIQIFLGGFLGWMVIIPLLAADQQAASALDEAWNLWSTQVRYIGVGTMIVGGVVSIWKVRNGLITAVTEISSQFRPQDMQEADTKRIDISGTSIFLLAVFCVLLTFGIYYTVLHGEVGITVLITLIMIVMAFFFTAVASYIVGLVGNSNSPVSGMTISTILVTMALIYIFGYSGANGMIATLVVAGVVCCVACTSGDVCNDLKTGHLVGATPRNQQKMQILGVIAAAFILAPVMTVLHEGSIANGTGGIGGRELAAPQAVLFSSLVQGFFGDGHLPWNMVLWGVYIGILMVIIDGILQAMDSKIRLYVMPVAVGIYLPLTLSAPILMGGILHGLLTGRSEAETNRRQKRGVLVSSGMIAGESLAGVLLGFIAYMEYTSWNWGEQMGIDQFNSVSLLALLFVMVWMYRQSIRQR